MVDRWINRWANSDFATRSFWLMAFVTLASVYSAVASGWYFLAAIPLLLIFFFVSVLDFSWLFWLLLACIPVSTEITFSNGLGTDIPTEPLIIALMLIYLTYLVRHSSVYPADFFRHPISLLLAAHFCWLVLATIFSGDFIISLKFTLAKFWYIATFFLLAGHILQDEKAVKRFFWVLFWPMTIVIVIVLIRHAAYNFSFADVHRVLHPFQRNHVNYAAIMALFFPLMTGAMGWYRRFSTTWWLLAFCLLLYLVAIYLSYTRAAYVALLIAAAAFVIIRLRAMKWVLIMSILVAGAGVYYIATDSRYLDYAPNFDRTISHSKFDNLIEATYKMEDISTMERLYRWVAGGHMVPYKPLTGWGPGNFTTFYRSHTVTSFRTYVSENPENSGIHNYFLMTLVEQGVPGLLIIIVLFSFTLLRGETLYHRWVDWPDRQRLVIMSLLSLVVIFAFLIINDLIETDKVGSFFFINLAILVNQEIAWRRYKAGNLSEQSPPSLSSGRLP